MSIIMLIKYFDCFINIVIMIIVVFAIIVKEVVTTIFNVKKCGFVFYYYLFILNFKGNLIGSGNHWKFYKMLALMTKKINVFKFNTS